MNRLKAWMHDYLIGPAVAMGIVLIPLAALTLLIALIGLLTG